MNANEIKTALTSHFGETILDGSGNPSWCALLHVGFIGTTQDEMWYNLPLARQFLFLPNVILVRYTCDPVLWTSDMSEDATHFKVPDVDGRYYRVSLTDPGYKTADYGYVNAIEAYTSISGIYRR
jgi:hypothetical protein